MCYTKLKPSIWLKIKKNVVLNNNMYLVEDENTLLSKKINCILFKIKTV